MIRMAFAVACGGVIGTLLRFALATWVSAQWPRHFYLATLAVNLLGCLLIGYLYATFLARPDISPELRGLLGRGGARECALRGGDDYELCFTAAADQRDALLYLSESLDVPLTRVGRITEGQGVQVDGEAASGGYQHFA